MRIVPKRKTLNLLFALVLCTWPTSSIADEMAFAGEVTEFIVDALSLSEYSAEAASEFLMHKGAQFKGYLHPETDPGKKTPMNDRALFSFRKASRNARASEFWGECWERSGRDQMNAAKRLLPNAKGIAGEMALKADEYLKKTYANVSRMRNCDVILKLAAGVDKARLDAAFSTQFEDRFGVPAERKFFLEKDVGSRLSEPVRHGDGVLIRLSYQYIGGLSSFRGIMVFADIS